MPNDVTLNIHNLPANTTGVLVTVHGKKKSTHNGSHKSEQPRLHQLPILVTVVKKMDGSYEAKFLKQHLPQTYVVRVTAILPGGSAAYQAKRLTKN